MRRRRQNPRHPYVGVAALAVAGSAGAAWFLSGGKAQASTGAPAPSSSTNTKAAVLILGALGLAWWSLAKT